MTKLSGVSKHWMKFILKTLISPTYYMASTGRKYSNGISFSIPGEDWDEPLKFNVSDLGYQGQSTKMSQLTRVYFNGEEIKKARAKLSDRVDKDMDFTSIAIPMKGGDKKKDSQGHCILSCIVNHMPKNNQTDITFVYRATEVIQKFGADLIFLHDIVLPKLLLPGMKINRVNFIFNTAFFSPLFIPVLYKYFSPLEILQSIYDYSLNNKEMNVFKAVARDVILPMIETDPEHYNYRTRRIMHQLSLNNLGENFDSGPIIEYIKSVNMWSDTWDR